MRCQLWPHQSADEHRSEIERYPADGAIFVAEGDQTGPIGFVEMSIRNYAEGCDSDRVAYIEGWYVEPDFRGRGVGRALVDAVEEWARSRGLTEIASDAQIDNLDGIRAHRALGFDEVERTVCFAKKLT